MAGARTSRTLACALVGLGALAGCSDQQASEASEPANVSGHVAESELATITLTPEAEQRLGIVTAPIERRAVAQMRVLGGEVIAPASGASAITRYSATASMSPSDLAAAQISADGAVAEARAALDLARSQHDRVLQLHERGFASDRARDDAQAQLRTAQAAFAAAQSQRALYGQSIASANASARVWVRASVYAGDLDRLNRQADARVRGLGAGSASRAARPIAAPAIASGPANAAFFFYEVDNTDRALRMGERVEVVAPTNAQQEALTVPYGAILYDINGGEWVYVRTAAQTYARQRVEVGAIVDDLAVLTRGPVEGAEAVTLGAAELFGTEFGVSH